MSSATTIRTIESSGLSFEAAVAGDPRAPLVLLLHGFPQTHHTFREQLPALADAGFYAVAPNQRGYSPGARPNGITSYATQTLVDDALGFAAALSATRFHLVGHDWGGQLSWLVAAREPARLLSLSVLSRPHPAAFAASMKSDGQQAGRSRHHSAFDDPSTADRLLEDDARRLRRMLTGQGVAESDVDAYLTVLGSRPALDAALNWYRAARDTAPELLGGRVGPVSVPTLYLWGDRDATVGRAAAELTRNHVVGSYRFEVVPEAGHFITDQAADAVTRALLEHIGAV
jgi:pimeloyl-ACP methyl ester carboxylesterase